MLEKNWERYSAPKFEQKASPGAGKLDCYWALNLNGKNFCWFVKFLQVNIDHLDIDPRDIMVFIYHSGRRLVESGQKMVFEREATIFIPTFCDTFAFWVNPKNEAWDETNKATPGNGNWDYDCALGLEEKSNARYWKLRLWLCLKIRRKKQLPVLKN